MEKAVVSDGLSRHALSNLFGTCKSCRISDIGNVSDDLFRGGVFAACV